MSLMTARSLAVLLRHSEHCASIWNLVESLKLLLKRLTPAIGTRVVARWRFHSLKDTSC